MKKKFLILHELCQTKVIASEADVGYAIYAIAMSKSLRSPSIFDVFGEFQMPKSTFGNMKLTFLSYISIMQMRKCLHESIPKE